MDIDNEPTELPESMEVQVPLPSALVKTTEKAEESKSLIDELLPRRIYTKKKNGPRNKPFMRRSSTEDEDRIDSDAEQEDSENE